MVVAQPGNATKGLSMRGVESAVSAPAGLAALVIILIYFGVVLPAIWSRKRARRTAAADVLRQLLDFFRRRPSK